MTTAAARTRSANPLGGARPPKEYASLLQQVADLQEDLSKTVEVCESLRSANETLVTNYDDLKEELIKTRAKYSDARREMFEEAELKAELETKVDELVRAARSEIEEKAAEMDALQAKLAPPRDLDMLRIKIQEELELPHQRKVAALETEVGKFQEMFFNVRKEHELLKTEYEQFTLDTGNRERQTHEAHKLECAELRRQVSSLNERLDAAAAAHDNSTRALVRSAEEARILCERRAEEVEALSRDRDATRTAAEQAKLEHGKEKTDLIVSVRRLQADKVNAERQLAAAKSEVQRAGTARSALAKRLAAVEKELVLLRAASDEKDRRLQRADDDRRRAVAEKADEVDVAVQRYRQEQEQLRDELRDAKAVAARNAAEQAEALRSANARLAAVGDELADARRAAEVAEAEAAAQVEEARSVADAAVKEKVSEAERARTERASISGELRRLQREKTAWVSKTKESEEDKAKLRAQLAEARSSQREADEMRKSAEEALAAERQRSSTLTSSEEALSGRIKELTRRNSILDERRTSAVGDVEARAAAKIDAMKKEVATVKAKLTEALKRVEAAENEKKQTEAKLRRKCEKYKASALKEHAACKRARAALVAMEQEAEAEREEHETATEALRKRLRELETGAAQRAAEARAGGAAQDETFHGLVQQEKRDQEELARLLDKLEGMGKAQD